MGGKDRLFEDVEGNVVLLAGEGHVDRAVLAIAGHPVCHWLVIVGQDVLTELAYRCKAGAPLLWHPGKIAGHIVRIALHGSSFLLSLFRCFPDALGALKI